MFAEWDYASILKVLVLSNGIKEKDRERPYVQSRGRTLKIRLTSESQNSSTSLSQIGMPIFSDQTGLVSKQSLIVNCLKIILLKE